MAGGLSLLLVLAFALAAGVPAGQLLATVSGNGVVQGETDLAVAPQVVERQSRRLAQERPVPATGIAAVRLGGAVGAGTSADGGIARGDLVLTGGGGLVREALLALPPPANG
jgi:hypothetical protein